MEYTSIESLDRMFNAEGVAIIGASSKHGKIGNQIIVFALEMDYKGNIYPVNPGADTILGLKCYRKLMDISGKVDLVVVVLPAVACVEAAKRIVERKNEKGDVAGVVVVSGGFSEHSPEGTNAEKEVYDILVSNGIRLVGPNCQGIIDTYSGVNTTFDVGAYPRGGLSFIAQSGAFSVSYLEWAHPLGLVGLNKYVSMGNMTDVNAIELLNYLGKDERTKVISVYLEGITNARDFFEAASEVSKTKPIVTLKAGKTDLGARAAQTHTASIAGNDEIYDCTFRQAGVIRTSSVAEFYDTSRAFDKLPLPRGNRICVLTVVGGPGTICLDELASLQDIQLAPLAEETEKKLREMLSPTATVGKPKGYIDMTGSVNEELHQEVIKIVLSDRNVDGVVYLTTPPAFLDDKKLAENMAAAYHSFSEEERKPFLSVFGYGYTVAEGRKIMEANGLPTLEYADIAGKVMINMVRYSQYRNRTNF
ncbi:MAG: CoA-binding protein [Thermodesulfobacteriota bacterium]|nr:CoA-binding protein [Thermodesulfobacteriota bacterium]